MNCQNAKNMILQEETSSELSAHLAECTDCAAFAETCAKLHLIRETRTLPDVPESLDSAVRFAARSAIAAGTFHPRTERVFLFRRITAAAAAVIAAAALALVFHTGNNGTVQQSATAQAGVSAAVLSADIDPFAAFDSELLNLSIDIDRTAVAYADTAFDTADYL